MHSSHFRRAASLAASDEPQADGGPDEGAVCTEGTAPGLSLTWFLLQHPMLKLHQIAGMTILRCKVNAFFEADALV
ncbi:hypothetical protein M9458_051458 [Cirrhinus mrigala]|uniref:Uncharacterized protein n=1 Tax=Cirrhinus mrigala TaxID=683832 RepID=A0ABD0MUI8_CIRMR